MILQIAVQKYLITNPLNLPTYFFYWQILAITSAVILFRLGIKKFVAQLFKRTKSTPDIMLMSFFLFFT